MLIDQKNLFVILINCIKILLRIFHCKIRKIYFLKLKICCYNIMIKEKEAI